jgi:hypothetical protein
MAPMSPFNSPIDSVFTSIVHGLGGFEAKTITSSRLHKILKEGFGMPYRQNNCEFSSLIHELSETMDQSFFFFFIQ